MRHLPVYGFEQHLDPLASQSSRTHLRPEIDSYLIRTAVHIPYKEQKIEATIGSSEMKYIHNKMEYN